MIALTLAEIARVVGGTIHAPVPGSAAEAAELVVDGAAYIDNRSPVERGLFVAITGARVDGHDYAAAAHAVLGSRPTAAPTVVVADPSVALGRLARFVVERIDATVLAMTGSQGKTGTKDLLAHVLAGSGPTVATAANNNNELGVPLTVLRADPATEHLVIEMGARGVGHIAYLTEVAPPRIAAVLNVGTAHIGEFGGRKAIAAAKGEIVEALGVDGTAVLNADDPLVSAMAARTSARVLTFGEHADVSWRDIRLDQLGKASFELGHQGAWVPVTLTQTGAHQVANAAAAAAMAIAAGMSLEEIGEGLSSAVPASRWRMELSERRDGLLVLNDAYNANPASMRAAIEALVSLGRSRTGRTIAVLGEMMELGGDHESGHREVGRAAAEAGVDLVVVVGHGAGGIAREAGALGCEVILTAGREDAAAWVRNNAGAADAVLVKASRAAALELVAEHVLADPHVDPEPGSTRHERKSTAS
ncbi:MAG: UDP-N-acetylmuramoyl-tripeptide--D-alanyl-D-alanine ligase [Nocardioides sp.]